MRTFLKHSILFFIGGMIYFCLEILWRGYSHWTMILVGGACFLMCGFVNEVFEWDMPMWQQMIICSIDIISIEFIAGCILNMWLGLNVWDYSNMPLNLFGQICAPFMLLWFFVSAIAIVLDDYLRYWIFGEEKPHYTWR